MVRFPFALLDDAMNPTRRSLLGCTAALLLPLPALAERLFPKGTVRGQMTFMRGQEVALNGVRERLSPGAQVRDERNSMPARGSLEGKTFTVNYLRDQSGVIRRVWLLSEGEAKRAMPVDAATAKRQQEILQHMKSLYMN